MLLSFTEIHFDGTPRIFELGSIFTLDNHTPLRSPLQSIHSLLLGCC